MPDDFVTHAAEEALNPLHRMLKTTRLRHRKAGASGQKKQSQKQNDQQFHCEAIRDGRQRMPGMNPKCKKQMEYGNAEEAV
jgi:hypothetical protein